jgi:hypothetical protein
MSSSRASSVSERGRRRGSQIRRAIVRTTWRTRRQESSALENLLRGRDDNPLVRDAEARITWGAIRSIQSDSVLWGAVMSLSRKNFFHKLNGAFRASSRRESQSLARRARRIVLAISTNCDASESLMLSAFLHYRRKCRQILRALSRLTRCVHDARAFGATSGANQASMTLHHANLL